MSTGFGLIAVSAEASQFKRLEMLYEMKSVDRHPKTGIGIREGKYESRSEA